MKVRRCSASQPCSLRCPVNPSSPPLLSPHTTAGKRAAADQTSAVCSFTLIAWGWVSLGGAVVARATRSGNGFFERESARFRCWCRTVVIAAAQVPHPLDRGRSGVAGALWDRGGHARRGAGHTLVHRRRWYVPTVMARCLGLKGPALGQHVGHRGPRRWCRRHASLRWRAKLEFAGRGWMQSRLMCRRIEPSWVCLTRAGRSRRGRRPASYATPRGRPPASVRRPPPRP